MTTPVLHVVSGSLDPDDGTVTAECTCGWSAPCPSRAKAMRFARRHQRQMLLDLLDATEDDHAVTLLGAQRRFVAACICGWSSRAFRAQDRAEAAARTHVGSAGDL